MTLSQIEIYLRKCGLDDAAREPALDAVLGCEFSVRVESAELDANGRPLYSTGVYPREAMQGLIATYERENRPEAAATAQAALIQLGCALDRLKRGDYVLGDFPEAHRSEAPAPRSIDDAVAIAEGFLDWITTHMATGAHAFDFAVNPVFFDFMTEEEGQALHVGIRPLPAVRPRTSAVGSKQRNRPLATESVQLFFSRLKGHEP